MRDDAPYDVRGLVIDKAYEHGSDPHSIRSIVCKVLLVREDPNNWSAFPNVDFEVRDHLDSCEWYYVYDIVEQIAQGLELDHEQGEDDADPVGFEADINQLFRRHGVGWQLRDGRIEIRGEEDFEWVVPAVEDRLEESGRKTAAIEVREAIGDLSRRPQPDITGAIQHALAALECVCRDVTGDESATLGRVLSRNRSIFPRPIDDAVEKLWGYASEQGRHLREGREPEYPEAELAVHISAAAVNYLITKVVQERDE